MSELCRIRSVPPLHLSEDFLSLDDPRDAPPESGTLQTDVIRNDLDFGRLDETISTIMRGKRYSAASDSELVTVLHAALPLTRREASDRMLWAWLGVVRYPHFVAWRWAPGKITGLRSAERFSGGSVRQTFARLWWAAELTRDGGDYGLTMKMFDLGGIQDIYEAVFGRAFCQYRPALKAFVEVLGQEPQDIIRETAKEFGYVLTTLVLEALDEDSIRGLLKHITARVEERMAA